MHDCRLPTINFLTYAVNELSPQYNYMGVQYSAPIRKDTIKIKGGKVASLEEAFNLNSEKFKSFADFVKSSSNVDEINVYDTKFENLRGFFSCDKLILNSNNQLTSFKDIHKDLKNVNIRILSFEDQVLKSNLLGILRSEIKHLAYDFSSRDLTSEDFPIDCNNVNIILKFVEAIQIIAKYQRTTKDIMECREEMIAAGLKEYAKL